MGKDVIGDISKTVVQVNIIAMNVTGLVKKTNENYESIFWVNTVSITKGYAFTKENGQSSNYSPIVEIGYGVVGNKMLKNIKFINVAIGTTNNSGFKFSLDGER